MRIVFDLPANLNLEERLPPNLLRQADSAKWLVSSVVHKNAIGDVDAYGFARLHSKILEPVMGKAYAAPLRRACVDAGVLELAPYEIGNRSFGHRLGAAYLNADYKQERPSSGVFVKRCQKALQKHQDACMASWLPIHGKLHGIQHGLSVDAAIDDEFAMLLPQAKLTQSTIVRRIRDSEPPFVVSSTGRCFNAITGMKRTLRKHLRLHGEPLGSIDVRCAQLALLAMQIYVNRNHPKVAKVGNIIQDSSYYLLYLPSELCDSVPAATLELCLFGDLYSVLVERTGLDRETVKLGVMRDVLAKLPRNYQSDVEDAFRECFPELFAVIKHVNRDDHAKLIRSLQGMESWLVIHQVCGRLVERGWKVIPLHDAVFSDEQTLDAVEAVFAEVFDELGCRLSLKREGLAA